MPGFNSANRVIAVFVGLWVSLSFGLLAMSCSDEQRPPDSVDLERGHAALQSGAVAASVEHFQRAVHTAPGDPDAALAYATARALSLADGPAARRLVALAGGEPRPREELLYGSEGLLARLAAGESLGAAWEQLGHRAPWGEASLASPLHFLRQLPAGVRLAELGDACAALGDELHEVASWFEAAGQDRRVRMRVPVAVLHMTHELSVGAAEASLAAGVLRLAQGGAMAAAAWLVDQRPLSLAGMDASGVADVLNERLLQVTPDSGRLAVARRAADLGFDELLAAVRPGAPATAAGEGAVAVAWARLGEPERAALVQLVQALRASLYAGGALLPGSEPRTLVQLEECFEEPFWPLGLGVPLFVAEAADPTEGAELALSPRYLERVAQPLSVPSIRRADAPGAPWTLPTVAVLGAPLGQLFADWSEPVRRSLLGPRI